LSQERYSLAVIFANSRMLRILGQSTSCACAKYPPLELSRDQIDKRIKATKNILRHLDLRGESPKGHSLFQCKSCKQFWQLSNAWNWGGKNYLFKVPDIETSDWIDNPYISPADMTIYSASMEEYFRKNKFKESDNACKIENCNKKSLSNNVLCKEHFIESLQKIGLLPQPLQGRMFAPYI
jgi:hypothetical protein